MVYFAQDSLSRTSRDTFPVMPAREDSGSSLKKFNAREADDIFRALEQRERELDSIARMKSHQAGLNPVERNMSRGFDTTTVPYYHSPVPGKNDPNPLSPLSRHFFSSRDTLQPVFLEPGQSLSGPSLNQSLPLSPTKLSHASQEMHPDWLLGIILLSLVLLAWLKLFYHKFFNQTIQSLFNYQLSAKFLRDQNIFSRRVAFLLNLNFVVVASATIYLVFGFFGIRPLRLSDFPSCLAYAGILSGLLILRYLGSRIVGHLFQKQEEFKEYLYQLLLIYKNLGIYLLAVVAGIAYMEDKLRIYLVYLAVLMFLSAYVFRIVRGIKIILNNKDVLIFYLILYLCTLEILPLLIFYRLFSSSVQAGQV